MKLQDVLGYFGSRNKTALALGLTRQAITSWKNGIPALQQYRIEELTKGKLKREKSKNV